MAYLRVTPTVLNASCSRECLSEESPRAFIEQNALIVAPFFLWLVVHTFIRPWSRTPSSTKKSEACREAGGFWYQIHCWRLMVAIWRDMEIDCNCTASLGFVWEKNVCPIETQSPVKQLTPRAPSLNSQSFLQEWHDALLANTSNIEVLPFNVQW